METKKTDAVVELADNGYILRYDDTVLVYIRTNRLNQDGYKDMITDLMQDLDNAIEKGECAKIRVRVDIEPITDNDNDNENERKND